MLRISRYDEAESGVNETEVLFALTQQAHNRNKRSDSQDRAFANGTTFFVWVTVVQLIQL